MVSKSWNVPSEITVGGLIMRPTLNLLLKYVYQDTRPDWGKFWADPIEVLEAFEGAARNAERLKLVGYTDTGPFTRLEDVLENEGVAFRRYHESYGEDIVGNVKVAMSWGDSYEVISGLCTNTGVPVADVETIVYFEDDVVDSWLIPLQGDDLPAVSIM